jgi:hypothetical protein
MSVIRPTVRSFAATGVSLVAASTIVISTITPVPADIRAADIRIASPAVQLTAAPNPVEYYPQVVQAALGNVGALVQDYVENFTPPSRFFPVQLGQPNPVVLLFVPLFLGFSALTIVSPVVCAIRGAQDAFNDVGSAIAKSDPIDLANAIVDIPARIADGLLNGTGTGDPSDYLSKGLLTPNTPAGIGPLELPISVATLAFDLLGLVPIDSSDAAVSSQVKAPLLQRATPPTAGRAADRTHGLLAQPRHAPAKIKSTAAVDKVAGQASHTAKKAPSGVKAAARRQAPAAAKR